jgi:curved DNA-binding protein CbpA
MFGLFDGASPDAVRSAFRRLAKVRHPDRFAKLGPSAIAAATESFQRLEEAYGMLKG